MSNALAQPVSAEEWWIQHATLLAAKMRQGGVQKFRIELTPRGTYEFEVDPLKSPPPLTERTGSEMGFCFQCQHWEARDAVAELGRQPSQGIGWCPLFSKLTEATHGLQCTAHQTKSPNATGSACPFCLRTHGEEGCVCAKCGCGLHPLFQRRAFIGSDPAVICPRCAEPPNAPRSATEAAHE